MKYVSIMTQVALSGTAPFCSTNKPQSWEYCLYLRATQFLQKDIRYIQDGYHNVWNQPDLSRKPLQLQTQTNRLPRSLCSSYVSIAYQGSFPLWNTIQHTEAIDIITAIAIYFIPLQAVQYMFQCFLQLKFKGQILTLTAQKLGKSDLLLMPQHGLPGLWLWVQRSKWMENGQSLSSIPHNVAAC